MSEYTKGPWEARKGAGWFVARPDAIGRRDAAIGVGMSPATTLVCSPKPEWFDDSEAEANARLMAAAPELLEALKLAQEMLLAAKDTPACSDPMWSEIASAIAKAQGK